MEMIKIKFVFFYISSVFFRIVYNNWLKPLVFIPKMSLAKNLIQKARLFLRSSTYLSIHKGQIYVCRYRCFSTNGTS
jgi:hypothetical protein